MSDRAALLERLLELLASSHAPFGVPIDAIDPATEDREIEVHRVGQTGVLAFIGDYVLAGWPDEEQREASRDAYPILLARLDARGFTRHMVHPRNFRSVRLTRKLGAKPLGVDSDGFVHYILTRERFGRHGKEIRTAEGA